MFTMSKHKRGNGFSNSAASGAKIVKARQTKLHIPIAVALFRSGNISGSYDAIFAKHTVK